MSRRAELTWAGIRSPSQSPWTQANTLQWMEVKECERNSIICSYYAGKAGGGGSLS